MIRFSLRLAVSGGREAISRLVMIATAVAIGVGLLLSTFSSINAVNHTNSRLLWFNSGSPSWTGKAAVDPLWWHAQEDRYSGKRIAEFDVAATGPTSPVPPGLSKLPAPGEYFASPALARLLHDVPASQLGDRFPGQLAGTAGDDALPSPDSLVVVIGRTVDEVKASADATPVTAIATSMPVNCQDCIGLGSRGDAMTLILSVVAGALIFPVLIFIGTATRLSAATREQRFAAMRLVGATPRQVSVISAVESTLAAVMGTVLGFGLFLALRPLVASVPLTGERFFLGDLDLTWAQGIGVVLGVPVAAAIAARLALRRVTISPLGVTRRVTPKPPRVWRLIPLVAGLGELAWFVDRRPATTNAQTAAYLTGFLLVMLGLVIAGPWFTMVAARAAADRTRRPAALIAVRRMADDPKAAFRAVSGLVLALYITTATVCIIGTINQNRGVLSGDAQTRTALEQSTRDLGQTLTDAIPDSVLTDIRSTPGFRGLAVAHTNPTGIDADPRLPKAIGSPTLVLCSDLAQIPMVGHCAPGASVTAVPDWRFLNLVSQSTTEYPAVPISPEEVAKLPVQLVYATTDGSTAAMEQIRTTLTKANPQDVTRMVNDWASAQQQQLAGWRQLANVVLLTTLPIAGFSLAVSVVAGLSDRRRPFALLRLTGAPLSLLQRVIGLESALPLLVVSAISMGTAFAASAMFLKSQMHYDLVSPGTEYYALTAFGIIASLGIIASTLPLLRRITGPEAARNG